MSRPFQIFLLLLVFAGGFFLVTFSKQKKEEAKVLEAKPEILVASINQSNKITAAGNSVPAVPEFHLRVISEPIEAEVWIDGEKKSATPYEFVIAPKAQKLALKLPSYEPYERAIPAAKDAEGDLVWKIQLKKMASLTDESDFLHGEQSGWLLQLKSVAAAELDKPLVNWTKKQQAKFCRATVEGEDRLKVVRGPYATKLLAQKQLRVAKKQFDDAFIEQVKCGE